MACTYGASVIVQAGETLYSIAQRVYGDGAAWQAIFKPDGTEFTDEEARNLRVGQEVCPTRYDEPLDQQYHIPAGGWPSHLPPVGKSMTETQAELLSGPREYMLKGRNMLITYTYNIPSETSPQEALPGGSTGGGQGPVLVNRLVYRGAGGEKTFLGNELQIQNTNIGMQVTVILSHPPDWDTQILTLLLPELRGNWDRPPSFTALALLTQYRTGFIQQEGALQGYEVLPLQGTVKRVVFPVNP